MKVDFLLSFKDAQEVQSLDIDLLKEVTGFVIKSYSKKAKKKIIKPILKCNLLKNSTLQNAKNKIENKTNLILNKISKNNFDQIIGEFLSTFNEITQSDYDIILQTIYIKILKDEKFLKLFYNFYKTINNIYSSLFDFTNKALIDLIEAKSKLDYSEIKTEEKYLFLKEYNKEENRINNLNLILLFIKSKNFKNSLAKNVSKLLVSTNNIPDIYFWFSNKQINKIDSIQNYNDILKNKLSDDINNRYSVLLKNLLESNNISFEEDNEEDNDEDNEEDNEEDSIIEYEIDEDNELNVSEDKVKSEFEIEIDNLIEEFLLLEQFDEVKTFMDKFRKDDELVKIFTDTLLNFYFNNNLTNFTKFKNLFINIRKYKLIKSEIFKNSLSELLDSDDKFDYVNLENKIEKIIEIYKIVEIRLSKQFVKNLTSVNVTV